MTENAIRTLIRSGAVPSARVGKKYLVAVEALEAYLAGTAAPQPVKAPAQKNWEIK